MDTVQSIAHDYEDFQLLQELLDNFNCKDSKSVKLLCRYCHLIKEKVHSSADSSMATIWPNSISANQLVHSLLTTITSSNFTSITTIFQFLSENHKYISGYSEYFNMFLEEYLHQNGSIPSISKQCTVNIKGIVSLMQLTIQQQLDNKLKDSLVIDQLLQQICELIKVQMTLEQGKMTNCMEKSQNFLQNLLQQHHKLLASRLHSICVKNSLPWIIIYPFLRSLIMKYQPSLDDWKLYLLDQYKLKLNNFNKLSATEEQWIPFIQSLDQNDWLNQASNQNNESLEAIVLRIMKKAPESSSSSIAFLLKNLSISLNLTSLVNKNAIQSINRMLKSSDETVRLHALTIVQSIIIRCFEVNSFKLLVIQLCENFPIKSTMMTSGSTIGTASSSMTQNNLQKTMTLTALRMAANHIDEVIGKNAASDIANDIMIPILSGSVAPNAFISQNEVISIDGNASSNVILNLGVPIIDKEDSDEPLRILAASTLGMWMRACCKVSTMIKDGLITLLDNIKNRLEELLVSNTSIGNPFTAYLLLLEIFFNQTQKDRMVDYHSSLRGTIFRVLKDIQSNLIRKCGGQALSSSTTSSSSISSSGSSSMYGHLMDCCLACNLLISSTFTADSNENIRLELISELESHGLWSMICNQSPFFTTPNASLYSTSFIAYVSDHKTSYEKVEFNVKMMKKDEELTVTSHTELEIELYDCARCVTSTEKLIQEQKMSWSQQYLRRESAVSLINCLSSIHQYFPHAILEWKIPKKVLDNTKVSNESIDGSQKGNKKIKDKNSEKNELKVISKKAKDAQKPEEIVQNLYKIAGAVWRLLLHPHTPTRCYISACIRQDMTGISYDFSLILLDVIWNQFLEWSAMKEVSTNESNLVSNTMEKAFTFPIPPPSRLLTALLHSLPFNLPHNSSLGNLTLETSSNTSSVSSSTSPPFITTSLLSMLLMIVSHPMISESSPRKAVQVWQKIQEFLTAPHHATQVMRNPSSLLKVGEVIYMRLMMKDATMTVMTPKEEDDHLTESSHMDNDPADGLNPDDMMDESIELNDNYTFHLSDCIAQLLIHTVTFQTSSTTSTYQIISQILLNILMMDDKYINHDNSLSIYKELQVESLIPNCLVPLIIEQLQTFLYKISTFSDQQLDNYLHPQPVIEARVQAFKNSHQVNTDDIRITNADRKKTASRSNRKGSFGMDVNEDEDWMERLKKEKVQKMLEMKQNGDLPSTENLSDSMIIDRITKEVREENEVIHHLIQRVQSILKLLSNISTLRKTSKRGAIADEMCVQPICRILRTNIVPIVLEKYILPLLKSELVQQAAYDCIYDIIRSTVEEEMVPLSRDLCISLQIVVKISSSDRKSVESSQSLKIESSVSALEGSHHKDSSGSDRDIELQEIFSKLIVSSGPIARLFKALQTITERHGFHQCNSTAYPLTTYSTTSPTITIPPLLPSTLHLLFPIFHCVLRLKHVVNGCDNPLYLLDCLWPSGAVFQMKRNSSISASSPSILRYLDGESILMLRPLQKRIIELCLRVLANLRLEPSPDSVFLRVTTQISPLLPDEWTPILSSIGLLHCDKKIRTICMQAILIMVDRGVRVVKGGLNMPLETKLWMMQFDEDETVAQLSKKLWLELGVILNMLINSVPLTMGYYNELKSMLDDDNPDVRKSAAKSIAGLMHPRLFTAFCLNYDAANERSQIQIINNLKNLYVANRPTIEKNMENMSNKVAMLPTKKVGISLSSLASKGGKTTSSSSIMSEFGNKKVSKSKIVDNKNVLNSVSATPTATISVQDQQEKWRTRHSIAIVFFSIGNLLVLPRSGNSTSTIVPSILDFILEFGVVDVNPQVRTAMLSAGRSLIDTYGKDLCISMLEKLEGLLARTPDAGQDLSEYDNRRSATVVLLGATGRHLSKVDPQAVRILDALIDALMTPSESVQRVVAECVSPLVSLLKENSQIEAMVNTLINRCLDGETYGERRGAAYGVSAFVVGLGIKSIREKGIIEKLKDGCERGSVNSKQGALFMIECLSDRLGILFEPYINVLMPAMLKLFGHSSDHVRDAAQAAIKVIMGKLSAHGVKQVLNPILTSLPIETAWKTRQESVHLLGLMAHCAPKQLASCLPQILPRLVETGSDPHPKVKESVKSALLDITSVIRNPEIARLSPTLLSAIGDPANKTKEALEALLECEFMHSIDAPSLALVIPILGRGLKDRSADLRRKSAAITGNMMGMVGDPRIMLPYLPQVLPGLKSCVLDPLPDVRATTSKALSSVLAGVGERELEDLLSWLTETMQTDASPVERSGAAQGLAEICNVLPHDRVEEVLYSLLDMQHQTRVGPREGLLWFFCFLPVALHEGFAEYISVCLPVILAGLSDDQESVREVALRSGQMLVKQVGFNHTLDLLPSLIAGLFHDDYRIRLSSVKLLGELLCLIGDAKPVGFQDVDEDEDELNSFGNTTSSGALASTSRVAATIKSHIGNHENNAMLASLYIVRSDVSIAVRQSAVQLWKTIVSITPKTIVEVMPLLVQQLIERLSSKSEDIRIMIGRALGEIVKKLGDKVLPAIIPHLKQKLSSDDEVIRQGVCTGLVEILSACSKKQADDYISILVAVLQEALCDPSPEVCTQGAKAFMTLFKITGSMAIQEVVPTLLDCVAMGGDEADRAIRGLREIVAQRPRDLLEYLLPIFTTTPIQILSAKALSHIVDVAAIQLNHHYSNLIQTLVTELYTTTDKIEKIKLTIVGITTDTTSSEHSHSEKVSNELEVKLRSEEGRLEAIQHAASSLMCAVPTQGLQYFISELGKQIEHETSVRRRRWGCWLAEQFIIRNQSDYKEYLQLLLKYLLQRVAEVDPPLLTALIGTMNAISLHIKMEDLMPHLEFMRNCINSTASAERHRTGTQMMTTSDGQFLLPLFTLTKSLDPFIHIFLFGLMNGSASVRELSADCIGELVLMAEVNIIKPLLIKTTGPLIRVIGERFTSSVKAAILKTLGILLDKGGVALKPFAPQLQTTFIKSLNDPSREVRARGGSGLGRLMGLTPRVDALLSDLSGMCLQTESNAIKASILDALSQVLCVGGDKATSVSLMKARAVIISHFSSEDPLIRQSISHCAVYLSMFLSSLEVTDLVLDIMDANPSIANDSSTRTSGRITVLASILHGAGQKVSIDTREEVLNQVFKTALVDDRQHIQMEVGRAITILIGFIPSIVAKDKGYVAVNQLFNERRNEFKTLAQSVIHSFTSGLSKIIIETTSSDVRISALQALKQAAKYYNGATIQHVKEIIPAVLVSVKDINLQVKYSAERLLKYLYEGGTTRTNTTSSSNSGSNSSSNSSSSVTVNPSSSSSIKVTDGSASQTMLTALNTMEPDHVKFIRNYHSKFLINTIVDSEDDESSTLVN